MESCQYRLHQLADETAAPGPTSQRDDAAEFSNFGTEDACLGRAAAQVLANAGR